MAGLGKEAEENLILKSLNNPNIPPRYLLDSLFENLIGNIFNFSTHKHACRVI